MMDKPFALIVEDNEDIVTLFQHVLDMAGYHTEIVLDGLEAMNRISAVRPDIVLLDLQLPGMTGVEILKQMRTDERLSSIPVVVVTAFSNYSSRLPFEPDLLLLKPVNIYQLSTLVQRLQATRGTERELVHDPITNLLTMTAFQEKLEGALARLKHAPYRKIGLLFADLLRLEDLKTTIAPPQLNTFLRKLADQFRSQTRPADTKAWAPELGSLLVLLEDLPIPETAVRIAGRIQDSLNLHLDANYAGQNLSTAVGVLVCDKEYTDPAQVLDDLARARIQLRSGTHPSPAVFDHRVVLTHR